MRIVAWIEFPRFETLIVEHKSAHPRLKSECDIVRPVIAARDLVLDREISAFRGDVVLLERIAAATGRCDDLVIAAYSDPSPIWPKFKNHQWPQRRCVA